MQAHEVVEAPAHRLLIAPPSLLCFPPHLHAPLPDPSPHQNYILAPRSPPDLSLLRSPPPRYFHRTLPHPLRVHGLQRRERERAPSTRVRPWARAGRRRAQSRAHATATATSTLHPDSAPAPAPSSHACACRRRPPPSSSRSNTRRPARPQLPRALDPSPSRSVAARQVLRCDALHCVACTAAQRAATRHRRCLPRERPPSRCRGALAPAFDLADLRQRSSGETTRLRSWLLIRAAGAHICLARAARARWAEYSR